MTITKTPPSIWVGQFLHFSSLAILLLTAWTAWSYLDYPFPIPFWIAIAFPVAHQVFVWLTWRLELRSAAISNSMGFTGYLTCFFLLFFGRFVSLFVLAWLDLGTLRLPVLMQVLGTIFLAPPGLYAMYSVQRYFGMTRAAGADHFDPKYRGMPLVQDGIFRFTNNGMYIFAFLLFWSIATGFNSSAALLVSAFSHIYIWIHFFATEKPDMEYLYSP